MIGLFHESRRDPPPKLKRRSTNIKNARAGVKSFNIISYLREAFSLAISASKRFLAKTDESFEILSVPDSLYQL